MCDASASTICDREHWIEEFPEAGKSGDRKITTQNAGIGTGLKKSRHGKRQLPINLER